MEKEIYIYYGSILLSSIFAGLAQKFAKRDENKKIIKLNNFFWIGSLIILFIVMGFRKCGVGVDDITYSKIFYLTAEKGFITQFLDTTMEPGYLLLNQIVSIFTLDFQVMLIITTLVPLILYYKALEYEKNNINLFLGVFLFGTIMFLYFCGITRLFIASSICAFAIRYLIERKPIKYGTLVLIAMLFHYSACIMMFLIVLAFEQENKRISMKKMIIYLVIVIPAIVVIVFNYIFPNMGDRYAGYVMQESNALRIGIDKIAILVASILLYKRMNNVNNRARIYITLYSLSTIISVYSTWFSIGRMQWYAIFGVCIILPSIIKTLKDMKLAEFNIFVTPIMILYGSLYAYRIVFLQITNECMRNYSNVLFK